MNRCTQDFVVSIYKLLYSAILVLFLVLAIAIYASSIYTLRTLSIPSFELLLITIQKKSKQQLYIYVHFLSGDCARKQALPLCEIVIKNLWVLNLFATTFVTFLRNFSQQSNRGIDKLLFCCCNSTIHCTPIYLCHSIMP